MSARKPAATCHEDIGKAIAKSPHEAVDQGETKHGFKGKACESCHGPGSNHVESLSAVDIRNPAKLSPAETDRTCLTCHRNQPTTAGRLEASHAHNAIACTSCHSIHAHGPKALVVRKPARDQRPLRELPHRRESVVCGAFQTPRFPKTR